MGRAGAAGQSQKTDVETPLDPDGEWFPEGRSEKKRGTLPPCPKKRRKTKKFRVVHPVMASKSETLSRDYSKPRPLTGAGEGGKREELGDSGDGKRDRRGGTSGRESTRRVPRPLVDSQPRTHGSARAGA